MNRSDFSPFEVMLEEFPWGKPLIFWRVGAKKNILVLGRDRYGE
jgi:hypothetical protein